jgi:hypothetical protein
MVNPAASMLQRPRKAMPDLTAAQIVLVAAACLFNGALVGLSIYIVRADRLERAWPLCGWAGPSRDDQRVGG